MWDFMCNCADVFYANSERVISVLFAWAVLLFTAFFVGFIFSCIAYIVYVKVSFYIEDFRAERGASHE